MAKANHSDLTLGSRQRFPTLARIVESQKLEEIFQELEQNHKDAEALLHQAESDLHYLSRHVSLPELKRTYKKQILDIDHSRMPIVPKLVDAVYEIYAAALLASVSDEIHLHAPGKGEENCDFRIKIRGCEIYGDVKTRYDRFPFNISPKRDASGVEVYSGSRGAIDYRAAGRLPPDGIDQLTPESGELRGIIIDALSKFPETKPNLIVLGLVDKFDAFETNRLNLEAAIFGDSVDRFFHDPSGRMRLVAENLGNGIFIDPVYGKSVTAIAWLCLKRSNRGLIRRSGIFFNPAPNHALPEEVKLVLERVLDRERFLQRELKTIVEELKSGYHPKKIILFGSLAQARVKEGSDIDLVVIKDTDKRPLDRCLEVAALVQPSAAVNFLVYTPEEFDKEVTAENFFVVDEILKKGKVLYER